MGATTGAGQSLRTASSGYDLLNRVRSAQVTTGAGAGAVSSGLEWTYDAVGNRLSESGTAEATGQAVNRTYAYDGRNRLTTLTDASGGNFAYQYDANGNLLAIQQNNLTTSGYAYDAFDQLREVKNAQGQTVARYDYDFARRRTAKQFSNNTQLRYSYHETDNQVVNEFDEVSRLTASYDPVAGEVVRSEFANEGERFYFADALGSVTTLSRLTRQTVNGSAGQEVGERTASYAYDAWGTVTATVGGSQNALGYTGQRHDGESGLLALGNGERYYAAGLGRFLQQDSFAGRLDVPPSLNRYAYAHNNPVIHTDPSGHIIPLLIIGGALIAAASVSTGTVRAHAEHNLTGEEQEWASDDARRGWGSAFGDGTGMTKVVNAAVGQDVYTGRELSGKERALQGALGAVEVIGNATALGGAVFKGGSAGVNLARGGAAAWAEARGAFAVT